VIPPLAALFAWPLISAALLRGLRIPLGFIVVIVAGYLLLPERFAIDLPLLPPFNKDTVPVLSIVLLALFMIGRLRETPQLAGLLPRSWIVRLLLLMIVGGAFGTALSNPDPIVEFETTLPGLRRYDGFSMALLASMMALPLLIGRKFLYRQETQRLLLVALCIAACSYAVLALYEVRMSPQLNRWFYGFFPHSWIQHVRGDGFRPLVFLQHGLQLSLFLCIATLAAAGLFRLGERYRHGLLAMVWLGVTLVLSKSLGALMIAVVLLPVVLFLNIRLQLLAAAVIGMMVLTYPVLRGAQLVPIDRVMSFVSNISADRAASFSTRLENEERMLERALQRPVYGWGGFARSRVRDEKGIDITIADGYWIIILGVGGWVRYIGEFGLIALPALFLFLQRRRIGVEREAAVLALMLSATLIDAIPNNGINPITWLIVGALWGRLEAGRQDPATVGKDPAPERGPPVYARDFSTQTEPDRSARNAQGRYTPALKPLYQRPQQTDLR
jgi:hypothetical protein